LLTPVLDENFSSLTGIDTAIFRYYIDGETVPSIEFTPMMACGVGFNDDQVGLDE
jgi:hypothetical protein